ncbi:sensor histidine kinase [Virgibacillus sp. DJP39]|uniref:sensor histidine kinase n=1 Tax=Virgibacillus sp. DJP39 TaxID=3409790 RepID=UPI003BB769A2
MQEVNRFYRLLIKNPSSKLRLVFLYRYISLLLTSFFYILGPQSPFIFKAGVAVSLGISALILTDLYRKYEHNTTILKSIVITETIGLTLLLIPTGGISSPFIWYALNPVLIAASFLTPLFCWTSLTFYLGSTTLFAYNVFRTNDIGIFLQEKSYFYLVCILTTLLASLYASLTKELDSKASQLKIKQEELLAVNKEITETNQKYSETLEHVMSLYHLMENLASEKSPEKLTNEITNSLVKCTQSDEAFFWLADLDYKNSYIASTSNSTEIEMAIKEKLNKLKGKREAFVSKINKELFWIKVIRTSGNVGILGVKISSSSEAKNTFFLNRPFEFLADLSEIMVERIHMDNVMNQMLLIEEQNRIANEIHDSVSQRLFGIVCSLHSLQAKSETITKEELHAEYQFLSQSTNTTIKELRSAIYRLSTVKKGEEPFLVRLKKYLDEYAKLNDVRITYHITGDESLIENDLKQALYRIICEACGNAVRHGKCGDIQLKLTLLNNKTTLVIQDNGIGISSNYVTDVEEKGIGLLNMKSIVKSFAGIFSIGGKSGMGTEIDIEIPNKKIQNKQGVAG